jgi:hypothetical protein
MAEQRSVESQIQSYEAAREQAERLCEGGQHHWSESADAEGDTCNCGAYYRFHHRIEKTPTNGTPDPIVLLARSWLERKRDGPECAICGAPENTDHEPTDPCGIVAGLLLKLTGATTWKSEDPMANLPMRRAGDA